MEKTNEEDLNFVENLIKSSLLLLRDKDMNLFHSQKNSDANGQKLHEVCINHRFSIYLEKYLKENMINYYVDNNKKYTRPDIIVHTRDYRNELYNNYLIIEVKKDENSIEDEKKIKAFMREGDYLYKYGCKIKYGNLQDNYNIKLYYSLNGKIINKKKIIL